MALKDNILRLVRIAQKINSSGYITSEELVRYLEDDTDHKFACSKNTVKRDISILRDEFMIDIDYSRYHNGYYIRNDDGGVNPALSLIEQFDIITALSMNSSLPHYVHLEPFYPKGTQYLRPIMKAIEEVNTIKFNYSKYSTSESSRRIISPYAIKQMGGRWYVIGKEHGGEIKTFGLDRISILDSSEEKYEGTHDFSMEDRFAHSYGIYSDPNYPIENITLSFDAEDGGYIKSVPLHRTQRIIKDTPDEFVVELSLRVTYDFIMHLLSRSNSLKVIAPDSLRKRINEIYKRALERNTVK